MQYHTKVFFKSLYFHFLNLKFSKFNKSLLKRNQLATKLLIEKIETIWHIPNRVL